MTTPWPPVFALLDAVWPRIAARIATAQAFGHDWRAVSTPFVAWEGGRAVAHVGVIAIPAVVAGERTVLAGIHAVCSHPDRRGIGLVRPLLEAALRNADQRCETAMLFTDKPALYEKFGFRRVQEHAFSATVAPAPGPLRRVAVEPTLVNRLLALRRPVSDVYGVVDQGNLFTTDSCLMTYGYGDLWYAEDLDALVVARRAPDAWDVLDVVSAADDPPGAELIGRLVAQDPAPVRLRFTPDRVRIDATPTPAAWAGDLLMVRGPFAPEGRPFAVSPLSHC
jgi:GNAT superfamily N-acetyltransferase